MFVVLPIAFVLFIWWFFTKYSPPKSEQNNPNLFDSLNDYETHHKRIIGKVVKYGLILVFVVVVILRVSAIFTK